MHLIRVIDLETTGINPASSSVCEVATVDLMIEGDCIERGAMRSELVKPIAPIPPESAIHDITDDMVEGKPGFADCLEWLNHGPPDAFCAHNASFEQGYFRPPNIPWFCTYKLALWLWPECPVHSIACLRYWLKLKLAPPSDVRQRSHSAMWDAYLCAAVLRRVIVSGASWDDMWTVSNEPAVLPRLTFGEHAMKPIADVPADYLQWIMKKGGGEKGFSEDVLHTAMHELRRRRDHAGTE